MCPWGGDRGAFVARHMLRQGAHLVCLGVTTGGHPRHPLYVRADQLLIHMRSMSTMTLPALTIWQPWASLIMAGCKPYEFRT